MTLPPNLAARSALNTPLPAECIQKVEGIIKSAHSSIEAPLTNDANDQMQEGQQTWLQALLFWGETFASITSSALATALEEPLIVVQEGLSSIFTTMKRLHLEASIVMEEEDIYSFISFEKLKKLDILELDNDSLLSLQDEIKEAKEYLKTGAYEELRTSIKKDQIYVIIEMQFAILKMKEASKYRVTPEQKKLLNNDLNNLYKSFLGFYRELVSDFLHCYRLEFKTEAYPTGYFSRLDFIASSIKLFKGVFTKFKNLNAFDIDIDEETKELEIFIEGESMIQYTKVAELKSDYFTKIEESMKKAEVFLQYQEIVKNLIKTRKLNPNKKKDPNNIPFARKYKTSMLTASFMLRLTPDILLVTKRLIEAYEDYMEKELDKDFFPAGLIT